jgi:aspartokinase/homoserine dehydrogenase 1
MLNNISGSHPQKGWLFHLNNFYMIKVLKFGGSSVANPERIENVIEILKGYLSESDKVVIVVSAQSGVTDSLVRLCDSIVAGHQIFEQIVEELEQRHIDNVSRLINVKERPQITAEIMAMCNELTDLARGASMVGELTMRTRDHILGFGERLSATVITGALKQIAENAVYADARLFIKTDNNFGQARINFNLTNKFIENHFLNINYPVVVTGFIGSTEEGQPTTLGRSGSDYTASVMGAALGASAIEIWTDTDGIMTSDPKYVREARTISALSYAEAMELSHFGAKVLFPLSIHPAMEKNIPVFVKNSFNPAHPGTLITSEPGNGNDFIKGISSLRDIALINVEGSGMVGVSGISSRLFGALSAQKISVILISQASSEHSICFAVPTSQCKQASNAVEETFNRELISGIISSVSTEEKLAVVAVVGENMRKMPGVAARVFAPLGRNSINVKAISQGSSERNISFIVHENDLKKCLRVLHQSLFNREIRRLHLSIAGTGSVGSKLLAIISDNRDFLLKRKIDLQVSGLINSRLMITGCDNTLLTDWKDNMNMNGSKADFKAFAENLLKRDDENKVFIDVTAADEPTDFYMDFLSSGVAIVAANKRANTLNTSRYLNLHKSARKRSVPFHYETNVGAGLPVINTIRNLISGGDRIIKIEAVLSGTINWLLSEYNATVPFSELVKVAMDRGYTEPDPRDDLGGTDVARKALILAREVGYTLELNDIAVEPLMPEDSLGLRGFEPFFEAMRIFDKKLADLYSSAFGSRLKMRYIATVENGAANVKLSNVGAEHPFYNLAGSENCLLITTMLYNKHPMMIKGPGAGVDVTAAGLLADIVRIAEDIRI